MSDNDFNWKVGRLLDIAKLNQHEAEVRINRMVKEREDNMVFDMSWLGFDEKPGKDFFCIGLGCVNFRYAGYAACE